MHFQYRKAYSTAELDYVRFHKEGPVRTGPHGFPKGVTELPDFESDVNGQLIEADGAQKCGRQEYQHVFR